MARSLYLQVQGTEKLLAQLAKLRSVAPVAIAAALYEEGEGVIDLAVDKYVPKDQGQLAGSHFVNFPVVSPAGIRVVLGFGGAAAPYAEAVHENPRAGKTGGVSPSGRRYRTWAKVGEWQYLEKAMVERARHLPRRLGVRIQRDWAALL